ncbi:PDZ domain-containing protein [Rarobacter faecitabidus]|uniref:endopeptidase La n=1 Tax=Rarobacter faecitabidus TaxID=13243 RepID=A0A542ZUS8_RARFA|nr:S16 family serine protease [Rarobacter faecitabidus]TQL63950.1 PDZ domain-containing protein [Rarobacter faecitabidus]
MTRARLRDVLGTITALALIGFLLVPMPYASLSAGQTQDVLGEMSSSDGTASEVITIKGAPTYPTTGKVLFTTVGVSGSPESPMSAAAIALDWFDPKKQVEPIELYYPPNTTTEQVREQNQADMTSSQDTAAVVALTELGREVPATLTVAMPVTRRDMGVAGEDSYTRAEDVVQEGDVILAIGGTKIVTHQQLLAVVRALPPNEDVDVTVLRAGDEETLTFAPYPAASAEPGSGGGAADSGARLGVLLTPEYDLPVDVTINAQDVGGPSAGMMFTLGIIDLLAPEDLTAGKTIAGTGTIDIEGNVGAIGGIDHKIEGAARAGATWFLVPESNCADISRTPPRGIEIVSVATVTQAKQALESIRAGDLASLPRCAGVS